VDVTVLVVNFRTPDLALRAMADARASAGGLEVEELFVDNGSGDDGAARLGSGRPSAVVLQEPTNRGFGAGVNAGLRAARGRVVVEVNSDAFCEGDAVARLVAYLDAHPRVAVAAPALLWEDRTPQRNAYRRFPDALTTFMDFCFPLSALAYGRRLHPHVAPAAAYAQAGPVAHVMGAVMAIRRAALAEVGLLDERYFLYLEETEWQRRVAAAGWEVHLVPDAVAVHLGGGSGGSHAFASEAFLDSLERFHDGAPNARRAALAGLVLTRLVTVPGRRCSGRLRRLDAACARAWRSLRSRRWRPAPP
jgi:GT2 family glycosyltransferase